jgi:hypothetical protein
LLLLTVGCGQGAVAPSVAPTPAPVATSAPAATALLATPTRVAAVEPATPRVAPKPTPPASAPNLRTFHLEVSFDTYETEETVQLQVGSLPGVASIVVTQLDITVQYDAARVSEDDILRTLRANPEVKIKDDDRAGR